MQVHQADIQTNTTATLSEMRALMDGVNLLNRQGRISFLNTEGLRVLGVDEMEDVVGQAWWSFWPETEQTELRKHFEAAASGQIQVFQLVRDGHNGDTRPLGITMSPVACGDGVVTSVLVEARELAKVA